MTTLRNTMSKKPRRKNRSISFPKPTLRYLSKRAKKDDRSVNYIVNKAVESDAKSAGYQIE